MGRLFIKAGKGSEKMKIREIAELPTTENNFHESILRSYQILEKVKYYLDKKVPFSIILELIEEMEK